VSPNQFLVFGLGGGGPPPPTTAGLESGATKSGDG
jgi:hypothetical protein